MGVRKNSDLLWIGGGSLLLGSFIAVGEYVPLPAWLAVPLGLLRLLLGLVFVLLGPGYAMQLALFPGKDDLDGITRSGLSVGLSIALISAVAFALDQLPWGLRLWPIFLGELLTLVLFALAAVWRRSRLPFVKIFILELRWQPRSWWQDLSWSERRIFLVSTGVLSVAALAAAWVFLVPSPDDYLTEFYILGKQGLAEDFPREAQAGEMITVIGGVVNQEGEASRYTVHVKSTDGRELINPISVQLQDEETWEGPIEFALSTTGDDQIVHLVLSREGHLEPYRALRLWINVKPGSQ